jgi:hypothetical protein
LGMCESLILRIVGRKKESSQSLRLAKSQDLIWNTRGGRFILQER